MATTPNYDLDIDTTLGGNNASDYVIPSQKAVKDYVDNHTSGGITVDAGLSTTSENPVQNKAITNALEDKQDVLTAGTDLEIVSVSGDAQTVSGTNSVTFNDAEQLNSVMLFGACEQSETPTPDNPVDIVCNNGVIGWDSVSQEIKITGNTETVADSLGITATAEMLLGMGEYSDVQDVLSGDIERKINLMVLDGTERWMRSPTGSTERFSLGLTEAAVPIASTRGNILSTHFKNIGNVVTQDVGGAFISQQRTLFLIPEQTITTVQELKNWLAQQYANGTPVMVMYPLANARAETVGAQTLNVANGTNIIRITQASIANLSLSVTYSSESSTVINFTNNSGYIKGINSNDVTNALGYTPVNPSSLARVATSGDFDDLTNKPTILTTNADYGITQNASNVLQISRATNALIDAKTNNYKPLTCTNIDRVVKVGVTTNTITLTSAEKTAACNWLGALMSITSANVTGALGYTPVNKAGDTMSGNLEISQDGASTLTLRNNGSTTTNAQYVSCKSNAITLGTTTDALGGVFRSFDSNDGYFADNFHRISNGIIQNLTRVRNSSGTIASAILGIDSAGNATYEFPICTTTPTTTSSASTNKVATVIQNYVNGTSGYYIRSDNYIEQWGVLAETGNITGTEITLLQTMSGRNWNIQLTSIANASGPHNNNVMQLHAVITGNAKFKVFGQSQAGVFWTVRGYKGV